MPIGGWTNALRGTLPSYNKMNWKKQVKEILNKHTTLKKTDFGYRGEIYADYRDQLPDQNVISISVSNEPRDAFYNCFDIFNAEKPEYNYLFMLVRDEWPCKNDYQKNEDVIIDWINDNVYFDFPYGHFLKQSVSVDVIVDTGDGDYDFTLNNFISYNAAPDEKINNESSALWLAEQQGYGKDQLTRLIRDEVESESKFLNSLYSELVNVTSHMNALTFLLKITLGELINYKERPRHLTIPIGSRCGLYDPWNGAGSLFEIELEKPVVIPKEYIRLYVDGAYGYGIKQIYGVYNDFWEKYHIQV